MACCRRLSQATKHTADYGLYRDDQGNMRSLATPWTVARQAPLSMRFSGKNTGVGCHALLQGIFETQGSNPGLLHCRQIIYHLSHGEAQRKIWTQTHGGKAT